MMKNKLCIILTILFMFITAFPVMAEHLTGKEVWAVVFTNHDTLESTFSSNSYAEAVGQLQPGDDITLSIDLKNENERTVNWYMSNKVLSSLEDSKAIASGGGYTYRLTYSGNGHEYTLFDSDTVGGDPRTGELEGLNSITNALDEFRYLDTLSSGQTANITLFIGLDGETQGNDYMSTLANLKMNFAVEYSSDTDLQQSQTQGADTEAAELPTKKNTPTELVKTGDENELPVYYIVMMGGGIIFLVLAITALRKKRDAKGDA